MAPTPGIIWVSSRIRPSNPTTPNTLTPAHFCQWYEDIHIQQVTALPGVPSAVRYEAIDPQPAPTAWSAAAPWLTVYELPDVDYRNTAEFKALDGQSRPDEKLLQDIFERARFDTRFYRQVQVYEGKNGQGNAQGKKKGGFIISAALQPKEGGEEDFEKWYREEHLRVLSECPGYVRTRRYEVVGASVLDGFVRRQEEAPRFLALHEFDGEELPWEGLKASAETEWAGRVMGSLAKEEIGWYWKKREYDE